MREPPPDLDASRRAVAANDLVAAASNFLTDDLYTRLDFADLVAVKNLLKRFFSAQPWGEDDIDKLDMLLGRNVEEQSGWFEHDLGSELSLMHGFDTGSYRLWVTGGAEPEASIFDRVFSGPVQPEATPNPRHVRFVIGGTPSPGVWYRRGDDIDLPAVEQLLEDGDVTDVLVAGDFVAIGLRRSQLWRHRLDDMVTTVTDLFWSPGRITADSSGPTREELVSGGGSEELHLLNPDDEKSRARLESATRDTDPRIRRMAIATLSQTSAPDYAPRLLRGAFEDPSRIVRRTVIDCAVDLGEEAVRGLLEQALADEDAWIRWKAVKGLSDLGAAASHSQIVELTDDPDFQVRFEVAAALRSLEGGR